MKQIMTHLLLICFWGVALSCSVDNGATKKDARVVNMSSEQTTDFDEENYVIVVDENLSLHLKQKKKRNTSVFEPEFSDLMISVNDTDSVLLDNELTKSEIYSPAFCFFESNTTVLSNNNNSFSVEILLGQSGCSGDFCRDFIIIELIYDKKSRKLTWTHHDEFR